MSFIHAKTKHSKHPWSAFFKRGKSVEDNRVDVQEVRKTREMVKTAKNLEAAKAKQLEEYEQEVAEIEKKIAELASESRDLKNEWVAALGGSAITNELQGAGTCFATSKGDLEALKAMKAAGANFDHTDVDGRSPLHLAASEGHEEIVKYLCKQGAGVYQKDRWGVTPMKEALRNGRCELACLIEQYVADREKSLIVSQAGEVNYLPVRAAVKRPSYLTSLVREDIQKADTGLSYEELLTNLFSLTTKDESINSSTFIVTYEYFTDGFSLLTRLIDLYSQKEQTKAMKFTQMKIVYFLKQWIQLKYHLLKRSIKWANKFEEFLKSFKKGDERTWCEVLTATMKEYSTIEIPTTLDPQEPMVTEDDLKALNLSESWTELPEFEIARQLCVIDYKHAKSVPLKEYYHRSWEKHGHEDTTESKLQSIKSHYEAVTEWVRKRVRGAEEPTKMIQKFIKIMKALWEQKNFQSLNAILSSLRVLKKEGFWHTVEETSAMTTYDAIAMLLNPRKNYSNYYDYLKKKVSPPAVLCLEATLSKLRKYESAPDELPDGKINWTKMQQLGSIFQLILKYQRIPYSIHELPALISYFGTLGLFDFDKGANLVTTSQEPNESGCVPRMKQWVSRSYKKFQTTSLGKADEITRNLSFGPQAIHDKKVRSQFYAYLEHKYCAENLWFYECVRAFKKININDVEDSKDKANLVYQVFIHKKAKMPITLAASLRKEIERKINEHQIQKNLFTDALAEVEPLVRQEWTGFLTQREREKAHQ